jgi:hypothetical protein
VKKVLCFLIALSFVLVNTTMVQAGNFGLPPGEYPIAHDDYLVQNNTTSGISVGLAAPLGPPFYASEEYYLQVIAWMESDEPLGNVSVMVTMGVDALEPPQYGGAEYTNSTDPVEGKTFLWTYLGMSILRFPASAGYLMAQLTHGNETVNLTYRMEVLPPRAILYAQRLNESNDTVSPELAWTTVDVMLFNFGGLDVANLVVDLVYNERILSTHQIPVITGLGNYTISTQVLPLTDEPAVEVRLVQGPGAPRRLGWADLDVEPRPILEIVGLSATPDVLESGGKVLIEAIVRNRGNASSHGQLVELLVDGSVVANATIEDLGPGNETTVSAKWAMRGEGIHSVSAVAEGDDLAASPVAVEVKEASPSVGVWAAVLALTLVSLAARRSASGGRA